MVTLVVLVVVEVDILLQLMEVLEQLDRDLLEEEDPIPTRIILMDTVEVEGVLEVRELMELKEMEQLLELLELVVMVFHIVYQAILNSMLVVVVVDSGERLIVED